MRIIFRGVLFHILKLWICNLTWYLFYFSLSRVIKTDMELEVLRYTNKISSEAHKEVMDPLLLIIFALSVALVLRKCSQRRWIA